MNGAPFTEMPEAFRRLQSHMLPKEGGGREMVDILSLVLHHDEGSYSAGRRIGIGGWRTNQDARSEPPAQTDGPKADRSSRDQSP